MTDSSVEAAVCGVRTTLSMAHCAVQWPNVRFIGFEANEWIHGKDRLIAFIGGAQIDPYGNVNSTCIYGKGDYVKPLTRFTGSGGANGIATYCNTVIMLKIQHLPIIPPIIIAATAVYCIIGVTREELRFLRPALQL